MSNYLLPCPLGLYVMRSMLCSGMPFVEILEMQLEGSYMKCSYNKLKFDWTINLMCVHTIYHFFFFFFFFL